MAFFSQHGIELDVRDVNASPSAMQRMIEVSGQSLTPTFEYDDFVVADFDTQEFIDEIEQYPEMKIRLGLGDEDDF